MANYVKKMLHWYFAKDSLPYWCLLIADTAIVFMSCLFSYWVYNKSFGIHIHHAELFYTAFFFAIVSWIGARTFHTYSGVVRYSSFVDLLHVFYANVLNVVVAVLLSWLLEHLRVSALTAMTQTQIVVAFMVSTFLMWGMRVLVKTLHDIAFLSARSMRVLIYGAMTGGIGLAKSIRMEHPQRFRLCGFISHDNRAHQMQIMGEPVYNVDDNLANIIRRHHIQAVLVSPLRTEEFRNNQEIQDILIEAGCKIFMTQQVHEANIKNGQLTDEDISRMQLSEVSVEDLLPRQEIKVDMQSVGKLLSGKRVLITGSAGSIGSEMVRQIAIYHPAKMLLIDQAETPEHDIRLMMHNDFPDVEAQTVVTSICKEKRMEQLFRDFRPDYVFHAAAYKHVPMMEDNPSEAVQNNILGTKILADMSVKYGVKKFVMVSTDKAVNPTNVMGCSKRICEIYVQALDRELKFLQTKELKELAGVNGLRQEEIQNVPRTQFVTTRFGNVLGSNGSVIPLFKEQIKKGGPVTVTDERIVRFFMLIPEACKLVLEAGTKGNGGEIFVFDMGKPVKIIDLARRMIALSGAKGVDIKITGLREGEKLYEEVLNDLEGTKPSFHEKIRIAQVREYDYDKVCSDIDELIAISYQYDDMATVRKMKEIVPEYKSNNSIYESLDQK